MNKEIKASLIIAGGMIGIALAASLARKLGYIDTDTVNRLVMGSIGLMVVWFGNRIPKNFVPSAKARQANRVAGWSLALSGLVYTGFWVFAPGPVATVGGCVAIIAGMLVSFGYCLSLRSKGTAA